MAKQGVSRLKVVSSGRLTASGRGQIHKKKVTGKCVSPLEPGYSLYSTDSEDQVTTIHKGLDRCAALLDGILQAEQTESKPKPQGTKTCTFKSKPKNQSRKFETDNKKKHWNKTKTAIHANKRPAPVQKKILSAKCHVGLAEQLCSRNDQNSGIRKTQVSHDQASRLTPEHGQQISLPLSNSQPGASCNHPGQVHTSTVFNTRLTTSTPALSPQRPGSAPTEPCTSKCTLSSGCSSGEFHQPRTMTAAIPSCPHGSVEISGIPNKHATSFSMPPAAQRQSPVAVSIVHNESCTPVPASPVCSVHELGSVEPSVSLTSSVGSLSCSSSTMIETQMSIQPQAQTDPDGAVLLISNGQGNLEEGDGSAESKMEKHGMDITPVRDISCQTSTEKFTALTHKDSPEKTAQKVMTVKYLLGELKTLVANHDGDAVRLISEVEQNISLLPVMVGSTNIQAEIALAVQPLRSENVQLRRRLRILNQQLLERERAERQTRPEACDMEVVALQSLNLALQAHLNESRESLDVLQQENIRLRKAAEDKDGDLKHLKDLCELENSRLKLDVSEALAEMQSCQSKLKESETEKMALNLSLQQREAEIGKLQDVIRNLQRSQTNNMRYSQHPDVSQPNSLLTKSVLELHEAAASDKPSNSVKTYLQTLEDIRQASPSHHIKCRSQTLHPGQTDGKKYDVLLPDTIICLKKDRDFQKPTLETIAEDMPQLEDLKKTVFVPLRETPLVQLAHSDPFSHCNEPIAARNHRTDVNVEMKYMGHGLEKLDISDGLHIQDATGEGRDYLGVGLHSNQQNKGLNNQPVQSQHARRFPRLAVQSAYTGRPSAVDSTFSSCDIKSLASDWSINSWSTFNTQDEQNFRDGLAALDASIESLQKTLKVDLNK